MKNEAITIIKQLTLHGMRKQMTSNNQGRFSFDILFFKAIKACIFGTIFVHKK